MLKMDIGPDVGAIRRQEVNTQTNMHTRAHTHTHTQMLPLTEMGL